MAEAGKKLFDSEDIRLLAHELKPIIEEANRDLMAKFYIDINDVNSMREDNKDREFVRKRRKRSESVVEKGLLAFVGICVIGVVNWLMDKITLGGM